MTTATASYGDDAVGIGLNGLFGKADRGALMKQLAAPVVNPLYPFGWIASCNGDVHAMTAADFQAGLLIIGSHAQRKNERHAADRALWVFGAKAVKLTTNLPQPRIKFFGSAAIVALKPAIKRALQAAITRFGVPIRNIRRGHRGRDKSRALRDSGPWPIFPFQRHAGSPGPKDIRGCSASGCSSKL